MMSTLMREAVGEPKTVFRPGETRNASANRAGVRTRPRRPGQGSGRRPVPQTRARGAVAAPEVGRLPGATPRPTGCVGEPLARRDPVAGTAATTRDRSAQGGSPRIATSRFRLTDRGIAVILVTGAMIAVAALTVVGATAWRVTAPAQDQALSSLVG